MNTTTNTEATIQSADLATVIALDAVEQGHPDAHKLLVGVPCTVGIGSDSYAARVVKATPSLHTITVEYVSEGGLAGKLQTFRRGKGRRNAGIYMAGRCYFLHIGTARTYMDPSF